MHVKDIEVLPQTGPRQVITVLPRFANLSNAIIEETADQNLDRTDVRPDNGNVSQEAPPILIDGVPSIENIEALTPKMRDILNSRGTLTVTDLIRLGKAGLLETGAMGPRHADLVLAEATEVASKHVP